MGQLPVTCGLFFSLGHSTIVIAVVSSPALLAFSAQNLLKPVRAQELVAPSLTPLGGTRCRLTWRVSYKASSAWDSCNRLLSICSALPCIET